MSYRLRHDWPSTPTRVLVAELSSCRSCGVLRVIEEGKPTRFLLPLDAGGERERTTEPPCIDLPPKRRQERERLSAPELLAGRELRDRGEAFRRTVDDGEEPR